MWSAVTRMSIPRGVTRTVRSQPVATLWRCYSAKAAAATPTPKIQNRHANKPLHAPRDHLRSGHTKPHPAKDANASEATNAASTATASTPYNNNANNYKSNSGGKREGPYRPRDNQQDRNSRAPNKEGANYKGPRTFTNGDKQTLANNNRANTAQGDGKKFRRTEPARVEGVKPPTILRTPRDRATIPSSKIDSDLNQEYEEYQAEMESLHRADVAEQFEAEDRLEPHTPALDEDQDPRSVQQLEDQELFIADMDQDPRRSRFVDKRKGDKSKPRVKGKRDREPLPVGAAPKKRGPRSAADEDEDESPGTFNFPGARAPLSSTQSRYLDTNVFDTQAEQHATSQRLQGFAADYAAQGEIDAAMRMTVTDMRRNVSTNFERELQRDRSRRLQELRGAKQMEKWLTARRAKITESRAELTARSKKATEAREAELAAIKAQPGSVYYRELGHWFTRQELLVPQVRDAISAVVRNPTLTAEQRLQLVLNVQQLSEAAKKVPAETRRMYRELLLPENLNRAKPTDVRLIEHNMIIPIYDWNQMITLGESEMTPEEKARRYAPPPTEK